MSKPLDRQTIDSLIKVKTDSITIISKHYQAISAKLDTMEKAIDKTEIGQSYFSEIINLQLTIFVVILGLLGLVSWSVISISIKRRLKRQGDTFSKLIAKQNTEFDKSKKELLEEIEIAKTTAGKALMQVYKAMYYAGNTMSNVQAMILWSLRVIELHINNTAKHESNREDMIIWINIADVSLLKLKKEDLKEEQIKEIEEILNLFEKVKDKDFAGKADSVKKKILKILYS